MPNMNIARPITQRSLRRQQEMLGHREKGKKEQVHEFYEVPHLKGLDRIVQDRVRILHPTKGWRDRNLDGINL